MDLWGRNRKRGTTQNATERVLFDFVPGNYPWACCHMCFGDVLCAS